MQIIKIGGTAEFAKKIVDIGAFEASDFPLDMQASNKYDILCALPCPAPARVLRGGRKGGRGAGRVQRGPGRQAAQQVQQVQYYYII